MNNDKIQISDEMTSALFHLRAASCCLERFVSQTSPEKGQDSNAYGRKYGTFIQGYDIAYKAIVSMAEQELTDKMLGI